MITRIIKYSVPGIPYFYAPDNIGSVRRVFTSSTSPTYDYDPYGAPLQATAPVTDLNYAGTFYNADSGLYLAVNRIYNPAIGRWLSRDPAGEAGDPLGNLYAYVGGDPIGGYDSLGLSTLQIGATLNLQIGPINLNGTYGLAFDSNGNIGTYCSLGGGVGAGANAFGGINVAVSNGDSIQDLGGPFGNVSSNAGAGVEGGVDAFSGQGTHSQPVSGVGVSIGLGAGADYSVGGSGTVVTTRGQL